MRRIPYDNSSRTILICSISSPSARTCSSCAYLNDRSIDNLDEQELTCLVCMSSFIKCGLSGFLRSLFSASNWAMIWAVWSYRRIALSFSCSNNSIFLFCISTMELLWMPTRASGLRPERRSSTLRRKSRRKDSFSSANR